MANSTLYTMVLPLAPKNMFIHGTPFTVKRFTSNLTWSLLLIPIYAPGLRLPNCLSSRSISCLLNYHLSRHKCIKMGYKCGQDVIIGLKWENTELSVSTSSIVRTFLRTQFSSSEFHWLKNIDHSYSVFDGSHFTSFFFKLLLVIF